MVFSVGFLLGLFKKPEKKWVFEKLTWLPLAEQIPKQMNPESWIQGYLGPRNYWVTQLFHLKKPMVFGPQPWGSCLFGWSTRGETHLATEYPTEPNLRRYDWKTIGSKGNQLVTSYLGGANSNIFWIFTPKIGQDGTHFDEHIFQIGWVETTN